MNKTAIKIFTFFILLASGISILLLLINFFSFSMTAADTAKIYPESQTKLSAAYQKHLPTPKTDTFLPMKLPFRRVRGVYL